MLSLKFPEVHKLLSKSSGELELDDPKKGVCIKDGHAIIVMEQGMLFFDLADYFVKTNGFNDNNVIKEMNDILQFMEGKMFSSMFWKELTTNNQVSICEEGLNLNGVIEKDLYYKEVFFDQTEIKMIARSVVTSEEYNKPRNAIYLAPLLDILVGLKTMLKKDTIILRTVGENTQIQFTFEENPWIYGVLSTNAASNSRNFLFDGLESFCEDVNK